MPFPGIMSDGRAADGMGSGAPGLPAKRQEGRSPLWRGLQSPWYQTTWATVIDTKVCPFHSPAQIAPTCSEIPEISLRKDHLDFLDGLSQCPRTLADVPTVYRFRIFLLLEKMPPSMQSTGDRWTVPPACDPFSCNWKRNKLLA